MFATTRDFAFFDYLRIPSTPVAPKPGELPPGIARVRPLQAAEPEPPSLYWTVADHAVPRSARLTGRFRCHDSWIVGQVDPMPPVIPGEPAGWSMLHPVTDVDGRPVSAVWTNSRGSVLLPFDPGEVMLNFWSERYVTVDGSPTRRRLRHTLVRGYYAVRPVLPRRLQLRLRRTFAEHQRVPDFPAWPLEDSLHNLYGWLFDLVGTIAGEPVPWLGFWPDGASWSMVLTHDVETDQGRDRMELLRAPERERGYRSSWNFVPERYDVSPALVSAVRADGCEVGLHGLRHDGRDLASPRLLRRRLPAMRAAADRWHAVGFRSPATQRGWDLMPMLGMEYDSSYTDSDPYEPQPGGCCTYLPYLNRDLVELPITLPQDHTLFSILGHGDGGLWLSKARSLRDRGGMVLVLAHPDYAEDPRLAEAWRTLLDEFADDPTCWQPLPGELASWWRDRATTRLVRGDDGWRLEGPGAQRGRVLSRSPGPAAAGGTR